MNLSLMLILLSLGILAMVVGFVWNIVKGAQQSLAWGVCLFLFSLPAAVLFLVFHPREGWKPLVASVAGLMLATGSVLAYAVAEGGLLEWETASVPGAPTEAAAPQDMLPEGNLMEARERVMDVESHVASETANLQKAHAQLQAIHARLNSNDAAAVAAYNREVESYAGRKVSLEGKRAKLASMQKELEILIDSAPRTSSGSGVNPAAQKVAKVVIYTTRACPACVSAKSYFSGKKIPYLEMDVEASPQAREEWAKFNVRGVPVIVINGQMVQGFDERRIVQLLGGNA